jgi:cysteine desulfurase
MSFFRKRKIYFDHAATTPVLPEVKKVMEKYWTKDFYNPSAIYDEGKKMQQELASWRTRAARVLEVGARDVVFTASGTESDNLAILGVFEAVRGKVEVPHVIISAIEHPGIREAVEEVKRRGGEVSVVSVNEKGVVSPENVLKEIRPNTVLISLMLANNEIGTMLPVSRVSRLVKEYRKEHQSTFPYIHTDASQAANYVRLALPSLGVDMLTLDASKMYGPKGVGLLVVRPPVVLHPIIFGGGQERGLRAGTENLALIAGFVRALEIAQSDQESESARLHKLKMYFMENIQILLPHAIINTSDESLPNIVSISFPDLLAEFLVIKLDRLGVMVSAGSACSNLDQTNGSTLVALGKEDLKDSTLRFSFGRSTTKKDIQVTLEALTKIMRK